MKPSFVTRFGLAATFLAARNLDAAAPASRADYEAEVKRDGPIAWWRFQDSACSDGAAAKDETGRAPVIGRSTRERNAGFEWRGSPYTSELVSDLMLQLIELGWVKEP